MPINRIPLTRFFAWLTVALALLWPAGVLAQEAPPTLQSLTIDLWPEFDRDGVLVIYNGQFAALPDPSTPVSLLLPPGAELNAVAAQDGGSLLDADYETLAVGDRTQITFTTPTDNFWIEFYAPADTISESGETRSFTHTWGGNLAIQQLTWHVQQPATASDLAVEPGGGQAGIDSFGLPDYTIASGAVAADETADASVTYVKTDDVLSDSQIAEQRAPEPALPVQETTAPSGNSRSLLPIGLAVGGVALLAGGVFIYWRSGQREDVPQPTPGPTQRPKMTRAERAAQQRQTAAGFCTNCGNPLHPGDKFCRECGTPVAS